MDSMTLSWVVGIVVLVIASGLIYRRMVLVPGERLMRCPEQDVITFVEVKPAPPGNANPSGVTVHHCGLWAGKKDCGQGCLERYNETAQGFLFDRNALRTFE